MVKTVLVRNMELNKDYMDHTLQIDELQKQVQQYQLENEDIRDRLSIMEALTGTDSYYIATNYSNIRDGIPEHLPDDQKDLLRLLDQDKMIALIYEYNKENIILKKRIERFEKKRVANKFMQLNDNMSSTAYTTHANNLASTAYGNNENRRRSKEPKIAANQDNNAINARCSISPKIHANLESDAEPMRCVIDAHELPNMNLSYYPRPPQQQLEPINMYKKKQFHNRREIRVKDSNKAKTKHIETLNSSLMSYDQVDNNVTSNRHRRPTTRNLTSIRNKPTTNNNRHNNSCINEVQYDSVENMRHSKTRMAQNVANVKKVKKLTKQQRLDD